MEYTVHFSIAGSELSHPEKKNKKYVDKDGKIIFVELHCLKSKKHEYWESNIASDYFTDAKSKLHFLSCIPGGKMFLNFF